MRKFILLLSCFAACPAAAVEVGLSGDAIKTTLGGSVLALDTPVGSTVTVRVGHDGMVTGDAGTSLGAVLGAAKDRGRWWVIHDQVCFKWFRWFDAEERCATISIDGNRLTWHRDDGDTGTGTIVEQGRSPAQPSITVADAKKPEAPPHQPAEKKLEIVATANIAKTEIQQNPEPKATVIPTNPSGAVEVAFHRNKNTTDIAMSVPAPHLAVRLSHDKIAVASVKPQYFKATKAAPAKVRPAKLEIAKAQASKGVQRPFRVAGVDPRDVLNIRNGPSPEYQTVGAIAPDSRGITMTGPCQNDWCPVKHQTLVGWVNRRYLAEETAANTAAVDEPNYWDAAP